MRGILPTLYNIFSECVAIVALPLHIHTKTCMYIHCIQATDYRPTNGMYVFHFQQQYDKRKKLLYFLWMTDFDALLEQFSSLSYVDLFSHSIFYVLVLIMRAQDFTIQWKDKKVFASTAILGIPYRLKGIPLNQKWFTVDKMLYFHMFHRKECLWQILVACL